MVRHRHHRGGGAAGDADIVFEYSEEEIYNDVLAMPRDEAAYATGALVRYCVPEMDAGKMLTIYYIDLLSAHFSGDSGKMWVKYVYQRFDKTHDLSTCTSTGAIDHIVLWNWKNTVTAIGAWWRSYNNMVLS